MKTNLYIKKIQELGREIQNLFASPENMLKKEFVLSGLDCM